MSKTREDSIRSYRARQAGQGHLLVLQGSARADARIEDVEPTSGQPNDYNNDNGYEPRPAA